MSHALNRSSAIRRFEGSNAIEIRDGITFNFYMGLPHIHMCNLHLSVQFWAYRVPSWVHIREFCEVREKITHPSWDAMLCREDWSVITQWDNHPSCIVVYHIVASKCTIISIKCNGTNLKNDAVIRNIFPYTHLSHVQFHCNWKVCFSKQIACL